MQLSLPRPRTILASVVLALTLAAGAGAEDPDPAQVARDRLVVESLLRIKNLDITGNDKLQGSVLRHAATIRGDDTYFRLAIRFRIPALDDDLFDMAVTQPSSTAGVRAASILASSGQLSRLIDALGEKDEAVAVGAARVLGQVDNSKITPALISLVPDRARPRALRTAATYSLGRSLSGQRALLAVLEAKQLPEDLAVSATNVLYASPDAGIRTETAKYLTLPATADATPLPPIPVLLKQVGDSDRGKLVFMKKGTCIKCHRVRGEGKEVGPDLSEIASKLTKEALLVSILDPSAGISHNYETRNIILNSGNIISGILVSTTDQAVTIKTVEAIDKVIPTSDIDEMVKSTVSLMPADIQKSMTQKELVDLLEFLVTLKKQ